MRNAGRSAVLALALVALVGAVTGCKKEGPAERAGRQIDQATDKAGQQMDHAGDNLKHAIKDLKR